MQQCGEPEPLKRMGDTLLTLTRLCSKIVNCIHTPIHCVRVYSMCFAACSTGNISTVCLSNSHTIFSLTTSKMKPLTSLHDAVMILIILFRSILKLVRVWLQVTVHNADPLSTLVHPQILR